VHAKPPNSISTIEGVDFSSISIFNQQKAEKSETQHCQCRRSITMTKVFAPAVQNKAAENSCCSLSQFQMFDENILVTTTTRKRLREPRE
jgi:hypothetical protein